MDERGQLILEKLTTKASLKQAIYAHTLDTFEEMKRITKEIAEELASNIAPIDEKVKVEFTDKGEFEFHVKFSGDTLVFQMHSNVVKLMAQDPLNQQSYLSENPNNGFFGTIRVYNFLSDTIKYNRIQDQGVLLARLMVNWEKHYHIESPVYFNHIQPNIEKNVLNENNLRFFIQSAMISAIDSDLVAPPYQNIQLISWQQQMSNNQGKAGSKLGFHMSNEEAVVE